MFTSTNTVRATTRGKYFFSKGKDYTQSSETIFLYVKANHLGSIVAITKSDGTIKDRRSYDAWGLPASIGV